MWEGKVIRTVATRHPSERIIRGKEPLPGARPIWNSLTQPPEHVADHSFSAASNARPLQQVAEITNGGYACAGLTSGGSGTSRARRITGGVTAALALPAGVPAGSGPCAEGTVLICRGAARRRGLPHGGSTRFHGGSTRRQGSSGLVRGGCGCGAGTSGQQREAVTMPAPVMQHHGADAAARSWPAARSRPTAVIVSAGQVPGLVMRPVPPLSACGMPARAALVVLAWTGDGSPFR